MAGLWQVMAASCQAPFRLSMQKTQENCRYCNLIENFAKGKENERKGQ
jgi:hypothetical protein